MPERRLDILKTYKLLIDGKFVRSESGRSLSIEDHAGDVLGHICHGSRKDLRDAVEAAFRALPKWSGMTAYNRGQILYRMAEMLQSRRDEFTDLLRATVKQPADEPAARTKKKVQRRRRARPLSLDLAREEVDLAVDRLVSFAGWADKFAQVLGCNNPVAGPYYNFTIPEPTGIVGVIAPEEPALLGLVSLLAPPLCAGNTIIALTSHAHPLCGLVFAEVCATSDVPAGVVNILSTVRGELIKPLAEHREVGAISAANVPQDHATALRLGSAENLKRVSVVSVAREAWSDEAARHSPWTIEPFVDMKTIWHPSAV
jgi:acyl-CoA reductase-like NAD-dependent aldehyde dehydrogenase